MKKIISVAICLMLALSFAAFAGGCVNDSTTDTLSVTVTGGEGSGRYHSGNNVRVIATVPEGKQFMKWIANGEAVSSVAEYVFKVEQDTNLVAVFGDVVADASKEVFTIKTVDGVGDGGYFKGSECTIKLIAAESDRSFAGWYEVNSEGTIGQDALSVDKTYTFKVTSDVKLQAVFADERLATPYNTLCRISSTPAWGDAIVELDRVKDKNGNAIEIDGKKATMFDGRIQYILIHVYDSVYAKKSVATFKFMQDPSDVTLNKGKFVTMDGLTEFAGIQGGAGNYYRDWISMKDIAPFIATVVGESYSADTYYRFASQLIAKDEAVEWGKDKVPTLFADSRISGLNSEFFCEND